MGFKEQFKRLARPFEEDDLDEDYDVDYAEGEEEEEEEEEPRASRRAPKAERRSGVFGGGAAQTASTSRDNNVVSLNTRSQIQVVLVKPKSYDNATEIADHLLENRTVILNMETVEKKIVCRLLDFLSGVVYANHGDIKPIATGTYLITPVNVQFTESELRATIERNNFFK